MTDNTSIAEQLKDMGFSISSLFVPYSQSRNAGEWESLNWSVTVSHKNARKPLVVDYSQGIGYLPKIIPTSVRRTLNVDQAIKSDIETGKIYDPNGSFSIPLGRVTPPTIGGVLYSLVLDGSADFDALTFEEWADAYGYDTDSRKAESTYKECVRQGAWIRSAVGSEGVDQLRDLFRDY